MADAPQLPCPASDGQLVDERGSPSPTAAVPAVLLLLADGRFPAGGYAHSVGLEEAAGRGLVGDLVGVGTYVEAALATVGLLGASLAVAAWRLAGGAKAGEWRRLDEEADARMASPAQREASRLLGRHLLRAAAALGEGPVEAVRIAAAGHARGPHQASALGALCRCLAAPAAGAAAVSLYGTATTVCQAAVRLLGLDPVAAAAEVAARCAWIDRTAAALAGAAATPLRSLPAPATPLLDYHLERHARREGRLFAT